MAVKTYLFRVTAALITFVFAIAILSIKQFLWVKLQPQQQLVSAELIKTSPPDSSCPLEKIRTEKTENKIVEEKHDEFNAEGNYYIVGKLPRGFKDFDTLSISTIENKVKTDGSFQKISLSPTGYLLTKKEFTLSPLSIVNKQILFTTNEIKGISYQFKGKFLGENYYEIGDEAVVLEGRLIKFQDGKKIAESKVKFGYADCGC